MTRSGLSYIQAMKYTAVVLATLALLLGMYWLGDVVLLFILSIIVAAALRPGVRALERHRVPRSLAVLLWYLLILGGLALIFVNLGSAVGRELSLIVDRFPARYDALIATLQGSDAAWQQTLARRLPTTDSIIQSVDAGGAATIGYSVLGVTSGVLNIVVSLIAVLTLTFYWVVDQERFERLWLTLLPTTERAIARRAWRDVEGRVGAYLRSEAAQFVLLILILWPVFILLGVPYPALYAFFTSVAKLVPWIGILLALLPIGLLALSSSWWVVAGAAATIVIVGLVMEHIVEPWMCGDVAAHPILTILALVILAQSSGVIGMLIALPLAALFQMLLSELVRLRVAGGEKGATRENSELQLLRRELQQLQAYIPVEEGRHHRAQGMLERLQALVVQAETLLGEPDTVPRGGLLRRRVALSGVLKYSKPR